MLSTDTDQLTIGKTAEDEITFAHAVADRLAADISGRCGLLARLFGRKLELYILSAGCHISNDRLRRAECQQSHIEIPQDDASRRETIRSIVAEAIPNIIQRYNLPYTAFSVEVKEVNAFVFDGSRDRYGMDFALRILLTKE